MFNKVKRNVPLGFPGNSAGSASTGEEGLAAPGPSTFTCPQTGGAQPAALQVVRVNEAQLAEWDALVERHPLGTIYHLSAWKAAMESVLPHIRARYLGLREGDAGRLVGGLALYAVRSWLLGNRLIAAPFATFCDPLLSTPDDLRLMQPSLRALRQETSARYIRIKTRGFLPGMEHAGFRPAQHYLHHFLPLAGGAEKLKKGFSRTNVRQWIQRAERANLKVERLQDEGGMAAFYPMFVRTRRRLRLPWLPWRFFEALHRNLGPEKVSLFMAKDGQAPVAGVLILHFKDTLRLEALGEGETARKSGALQLVYWTIIQWACQEGYSFVSFGRSNRNNVGLVSHKRRWGCIEEPLTDLFCLDASFRSSHLLPGAGQSLARGCVRLLVRRVPLPVGSALSRFFYRHWA